MDFELRRASEKLEKEQRERKEKARLKLERERKAQQEALLHRQAIEAAQRERRLIAVEAEAKATSSDLMLHGFSQANLLKQEDLMAGRGVNFTRILEALPYQGSGDKIKLPPSCFTELSEKGAFDKGPLHFSLSLIHQENSLDAESAEKELTRTTHAGVLEFTAEEGFVALPQHCWNNLFNAEALSSALVEVRYVWLPKGTYAKLQSVEVVFSDIPNHKAVLETSLRQHATLSQGDVLTVTHGAHTYGLRVLELKPSSSVSVLETDVEVDIIGPEFTDREDLYVLKPLIFGKLENGVVHEENYVYYKFTVGEDTWSIVSSKETNLVINLVPTTQEGDIDLYVSRHPLLFPTQHQHIWSSHDMGSKALVLSAEDENLGPGTYSIAVFGFKGTSQYHLSVNVEEVSKQKSGQHAASSSSATEVDTLECRNCKRFVPSRTIALHEVYCSRHNTTCRHAGCGIVLRVEEAENHVHCEKCGKAFQKGEIEKHMKVFHEPLHCPCGVVLEKEHMVQHQSLHCPLRLITCRFCGDMVPAGISAGDARDRMRGLSEHESLCGSRTAPCDSCGRSVMLKDMDIHQIAVHQKN